MSEKMSLFARLRQGMTRSRQQMAQVMEAEGDENTPLTEDYFDSLLDAMILSDMGAPCAE